MSPSKRTLPRFRRSILFLGLSALAVAACRPVAPTIAEPAVSAIIVRNTSQYDVNVYALPRENAKPVWLGTVPAAGTRSLALNASALSSDRNLMVRTQATGSTRSWTSTSVAVDRTIYAVLDLAADRGGDCSESRLYTADARETGPIMW